ncbi:MAG: ABC transporter permease [Sandaracinaceae bacterium]|nr:ABC transporter permease [Sandaracinaceae bacterium]
MRALYLKELRSLWPFLVLTSLLMSGDLIHRPFMERLDEQTWEGIASYLRAGEDGTFGWVFAILAVCIAYAAFPREHDEGTIRFLHSLPVRRPLIFVAKVAAGLTIVWTGVGLLLLTDTAQSVWNTSSFEGGHWRADIALTHVAMQVAFGFIAYAHGLLGSVLRRFGILPYALVLVVASILKDVFPPAAWIDPTELLVARYEGSHLVIAWGPWIAHGFVALVALATAYAAWMGPADRIGAGLGRAGATLAGKLAFGCGTALAGVGVLALSALVSSIGPSDEPIEPTDEPVEVASIDTRQARTARYEVTYPANLEARASALIEHIDAIHAGVQRELGADVGPVLVADLTETSSEHLGIASWTHLRVGLVGERDVVRLHHTFAHETVHAFQHRLSDLRQGDAERATHFFAEGSAEHVAFRVAPNGPAHRQARAVAAATWARHRMSSDDLIDERALRRRFDTSLVYSLGDRWSAALASTCGDAAIGDALRAMAREGAPRDLAPRAFWEDTLRAIGCDLESVDAAFDALMDADAEELTDVIDGLPRLGGGVAGRDGATVRVVALLDRDVDPSMTFFVRLRSDPDSEDTETITVRGQRDPDAPRRVVHRVSRALIPSSRFQLQLCALDDPRGWPFCETWQWASVP